MTAAAQSEGRALSSAEEVQEARREADPLLALAGHSDADALPALPSDLAELQRRPCG